MSLRTNQILGDRDVVAPCSALLSEPRGERAVEALAKWEHGALLLEAQSRKLLQSASHDSVVLVRFDAARAIDEDSTRLQQRDKRAEDRKLFVLHALEICRFETPTHINAASHYACIRAGRIEQDAVERLFGESAREG